jgi:predicted SAM-dependent methyltransferase
MDMNVLIKINLNQALKSGEAVIVELGCGTRKKKIGSIGIDIADLPGVDIVADLENGLPFLPDRSVDRIHCRSVFEHIKQIRPSKENAVNICCCF